ncbi:MAG: succinate dehydrogenase flavoprotein subunit [Deltaproteobacteria bacterium]|nr:MAG: succinate dehydrogenase flavoprotein subunit [Deltaproteobacteria bacterium]
MAERYIVVGGGLAGLMTVIKLAEAGKHVDVFSIVPVKRSHSVCAQGGINGAVNTKGEGDHPDIHTRDTLRSGDFLLEQPPVKGMCYAAPQIIYLLDRMGVPFNRTSEGLLDFRRFGGTLHHRTAFSGASTGQQLLYALDEQVRRYESEGLVRKFEYWEYLSFVKDAEGACRGIVALDLRTMQIEAFPADAVCLATGGPGIVYGRSTNSTINTGTAASRAYIDGAIYTNAEFIQVHPTAIPGEDKHRLMSESARGEGGRIWVPKNKDDKRDPRTIPENERWFFLEEKYPKYRNLVPRDVASREIVYVVRNLGRGVEGQEAVYLDVTHIPAATLDRKLGGIMEIYEKFVGVDPRHTPMKIFPAVHYSMGGLWVDYEADARNDMVPGSPRQQATNIPGLYAAGEVDYGYHGANRLGANSLLSCIYAGMIAGPAMISYAKNVAPKKGDVPKTLLGQGKTYWSDRFDKIYKMDGTENPFVIGREMGELMQKISTVVKFNKDLDEGVGKIREMKERWKRSNVLDTGRTLNQSASYVNQLWNMLELAELILVCGRLRDESRGSHYKPDFALPEPKTKDPTQDPQWMEAWRVRNEKWLKLTMARFSADGPKVTFEPLKSLANPILKPEPRWYA